MHVSCRRPDAGLGTEIFYALANKRTVMSTDGIEHTVQHTHTYDTSVNQSINHSTNQTIELYRGLAPSQRTIAKCKIFFLLLSSWSSLVV